MKLVRALGVVLATVLVVALAAGAGYLAYVLRLWGQAVRATEPFDPAEPI